MAVYSNHEPHKPCWIGMNSGQQYRLRLRIWEHHQGEDGPSLGTLSCNEWDYQHIIAQAGGAAGCFKTLSLPVTATLWCDFTAIPASHQDMHLELRLLALNNQALGEPFYELLPKHLSSQTLSLMLAYA